MIVGGKWKIRAEVFVDLCALHGRNREETVLACRRMPGSRFTRHRHDQPPPPSRNNRRQRKDFDGIAGLPQRLFYFYRRIEIPENA